MESKICKKCKKKLPLDKFTPRYATCKECRRIALSKRPNPKKVAAYIESIMYDISNKDY
jgi:hypothetical protein